jgi:opacity protein-like surface antigen
MKKVLLGGACAASLLLALTPVVQAADMEAIPGPAGMGWYVSVFGGWSHPTEDIDAFFSSGSGVTFTSVDASFDLDDGFMAGLAIGAQFNDWLRADIEASGHWHDAEGNAILGTVTNPTTPVLLTTTAGIDGDANALFLLANLWIDVPLGDMVRPYIGGGVGVGRLDVDVSTTGGGELIDDADWGFAYQLGAGIGFGITPNIAVDVGYRFKAINNLELDATAPSGTAFDVDADYKSHNVLLGLRFGF